MDESHRIHEEPGKLHEIERQVDRCDTRAEDLGLTAADILPEVDAADEMFVERIKDDRRALLRRLIVDDRRSVDGTLALLNELAHRRRRRS